MQANQQPTPPAQTPTRTSGAPQAPAAPVIAGPNAPMTEQQKQELKATIKKSIQDAANGRDAARIARQAVTEALRGTQSSTTIAPPDFDPQMMKDVVENVTTGFFFTVAAIAIGIPLVRALGRRLGPAPAPAVIPPAMTDQLKRIETAVESMAIEIERISESQRFLAKLQTGRSEMAALPREGSSGA